ncbi:S8 family serine peptidase [Myxococcota bacterium]|nr:S8 family serine peptidase [Myxococcota bacterium]
MHTRRRSLSRLALAVPVLSLLAAACTGPNPAATGRGRLGGGPEAPYFEGELVVRFPAGTDRATVEARIAPWGAAVLEGMGPQPATATEETPVGVDRDALEAAAAEYVDGLYRLSLPEGVSVEAALDLLAVEGETLYAEPNYLVTAYETPDDPRYGELWGMPKIGAPAAWDHTTGSADVLVAVIDTGLDYTHPDLRDNAWRNPGETAGNGRDDDGNGYVDDVYGWDFCNNDADPMDDHGHGTHCAGTITGRGDNGLGVAGVSWRARVMGLKFLCANGSGSTYGASLAVRYAADVGATFTSNSWGGGGFSQALYDTILYAQSRNQLFVAAAGNDGKNLDVTNGYPAGYDLPNIVSVAASDGNDAKASFSNYGATRVDLAAPGVGILSTLPGDRYAAWSGTSMATPHVAGALALYYAAYPAATWSGARDALLAAVDPVAAWRGVVATGGRLNVGRMLAGVAPPPPAPTNVSVVADGPDGLKVAWQAPADPSVTGYLVYTRHEGGEVRPAQPAAASPARVAPLAVGRWWASVAAVSPGGTGPRSAEVSLVLADATPPARILDLTVRAPAGAVVDVAGALASSDFGPGWEASGAVDGDPLSGWAAEPSLAPEDARLSLDLGGVQTVGRVDLAPLPGFEALFPPGLEVRALTGSGWTVLAAEVAGAPDAAGLSFTFAPVPTDRVELRITERVAHEAGLHYAVIGEVGVFAPPVDPTALELGFTAPGDDGAAGRATAYDLRVSPGLTEAGFDAAPRHVVDAPAPAGQREHRTVSGLPTRTTVGVSIAAVDDVGLRGPPSPVVFATTGALPPGAPRDVVAVAAGPDWIDLRWVAPADDGEVAASGSVAGYELRWSDRVIGAANWPAARRFDGPAPVAPGAVQSFRLTGLPVSPRHHVRLAAIDGGGLRGPWSPDVALDAPAGPDVTPPAAVAGLVAGYVSGLTEPVALAGESGAEALTDGDAESGWMLDGVPGEALSLNFSLGQHPRPLTRIALTPHALWPGDTPATVVLRTLDPLTGTTVERARAANIAPGAPVVLDLAPVEVTGFTLDLVVGPARFGVGVVALAEVEAFAALPDGGQVRLTWVAPGDDGWLGRAAEYELRRASQPMETPAAFAAGTRVVLPAPAEGGSLEVASLPGLPEGAPQFYALRAQDDAGLWSPPGNNARVDPPAVPPGAVRDLRVVAQEKTAIEITFTAPGDDGFVGRAARYDLRFVEGEMTAARFAAATVAPTPAPAPAGSLERVRLDGLRPGTAYGVAVLTADEGAAVSGLSNVVAAVTVEAVPPAAVLDLGASAGPAGRGDAATLRFTAPGDDGNVGRAARYDLRFSETPLTPETFGAAQAAATPAPALAGSAESVVVTGLAAERRYHFALTATDDAGNPSALSNGATYDTPAVPPAAVADLRLTDREADALTARFTATGDDGAVGQAAAYDLRWARAPITTDAEFAAATRVATPLPRAAGAAEAIRVAGLPTGTRLHFAMLVRDDRGATSPRSASVSGDTLDALPPGRVGDLRASAVLVGAAVDVVAASASSALLPETSASALGDENPSSAWLGALRDAPAAEWLLLDFGAPVVFDRLLLRPAEGYAAQFPAALRVEYGTDEPGREPLLLLDEVGLTMASDEDVFERAFAPVTARWVRVSTPQAPAFGDRYLVAIGSVDVIAADPATRSVVLAFTAPADTGPTGRVAAYDVRAAPQPFDPAAFAGYPTFGGPAPVAPGLPQAFTATGLAPQTAYGFAVVAIDADGNRGLVSNVASVTTAGVPPTTIVDLRADAPEETALTLRFTAPNDAGAAAARYELRRLAAPMNATNFANGALVATSAPALPGTAESVRVTGLVSSVTYWFALRSADALGNLSAISNVLAVRTADPPERVAPERVADLRAATAADADGAVALTWTATGDDGRVGRATSTDLRWALAPITDATFAQATRLAPPAPQAAGSLERYTATGLPGEQTIHFALKVIDDVGNVSALSNTASAPTRPMPPATIADLRLERDGQTAVLRFTAPGADGAVGRATRYEVFIETRAFASASGLTPWAGAPAPGPAGTAEVLRVPDRPADATTYAAVRAVDEKGNAGPLSPVVSVAFPDPAPPAPPAAVELTTGADRGTLRLRFTSPGDDGVVGTAARYEVRWGEAAFNPFTAGTAYAGLLSVVPGGATADLVLRNLPDERPIYVAVRAVDNTDAAGPASAVLNARTPDVAPARVGDLRATAAGATGMDLSWTAPGDDGTTGRAARYEVRRAEAVITDATWAAATVIDGAPAPAAAGTPQSLRVSGLVDGRTYHFALKTTDDRGNVSPLSNSATAATEDRTPPAAVADLTAEREPNRTDALRLRWTAAGDDGAVGTIRRIEVRVAAGAWPGWAAATPVAANFAPGPAGTAQTVVISGLRAETAYRVALSSYDEADNAAVPSNVAVAETGDVPPGAVGQLAAAPDGPGAIRITFVAPADDGVDASSGRVTRYEIAVAAREVSDFTGLSVRAGPDPVNPGSGQAFRLTGLNDDTPYWVLVRAVDDQGNAGAIAPPATAKTVDVTPPGAVMTLVAQPPRTDADPVLTGAASASATLSAAWPADAAFDADPDSAWAAPPVLEPDPEAAAPALTVALDGRPRVGGLRLFVGGWPAQFPTAFDLALEGEPVGRFEGLEPARDQWIEVSFEPVAAASLTLTVVSVGDPNGYVVVSEVEVLPADDPPDSVVLSWVAPGDNGAAGTATRYELRVSDVPIDAANFDRARAVPAPAPQAAGRPQSTRVVGLDEDTVFHFAIRAVDEAGNKGPVGNSASARTGGVPPEAVSDLTATADGPNAVLLTFTAPDDDAGVAVYDLRYRAGALSDPTWAQATRALTPAPAAPGTRQQVRIAGLLPGTGYAFGLRAVDALGFTSRTSNLAFALTAPGPDLLAPGAVGDLRARAVAGDGRALATERVTASGGQFPDLPPAAAVDGDPATAWASPTADAAGEEWLRLTLPAAVAVDRVRLRAAAEHADLFPADFVLEGSLDGEHFEPLRSVSGHVADPARAAAFDFAPTPVRELRLRAERAHRGAHWLVVVAEVEVFEAAAPDAVTLTFLAAGDDGDVGVVTGYRIGRAAAPLTEASWAQAVTEAVELAPLPAGAPQAVVLTDLPAGRHQFAVRAVDEAGHLGPVGASVVFDVR